MIIDIRHSIIPSKNVQKSNIMGIIHAAEEMSKTPQQITKNGLWWSQTELQIHVSKHADILCAV